MNWAGTRVARKRRFGSTRRESIDFCTKWELVLQEKNGVDHGANYATSSHPSGIAQRSRPLRMHLPGWCTCSLAIRRISAKLDMRDGGKLPLVNLDLQTGPPRNGGNAEFLAARRAAGVVSTHSDILRAASKQGLITVQRTYALDSAAGRSGRASGKPSEPERHRRDPACHGSSPRSRTLSEKHPMLRVVAGGLIADPKEVECMLAPSIDAVSGSEPRFRI